MVKTNRTPVTALVSKTNDSQNSFHSSSIAELSSDLPEEDNWVIVKKQKVNILIPHLSSSERRRSSEPDLPQSQLNLAEGNMPPQQFTLPDKAASNPEPMKIDSSAKNVEHKDNVFKPPFRKKRSVTRFHGITRKPSRAFSSITVVDKTMRASNVKIKIARAGGVRRWLSSLGLERFERIFDGGNISKFQVMKLSMDKLKEMGYHSVGPRRKLIHAIECPC